MSLPKHLQPRREPRQERSRALVESILDAASEKLVEAGFEGMGMLGLAERAGVSPGSLYQYFPSKESVVAALLERQSQKELEWVGRAMAEARPSSVMEAIAAAVGGLLSFKAQDPKLQKALAEAVGRLGRYDDLAERGRAAAARLKALLAPLHRSVPGGPDLDTLVFVVGNAIHSLTHEGVLARPPTLDDRVLAREVMRLVRGYLAAIPGPDVEKAAASDG
jgi:AcrR family transcriptional regulator